MDGHWLTRPETIRRLWRGFIAVLVAVVVAELAVDRHGVAGIDGWFGFGAWFGFLSCVALVFLAKAVGVVLKRPDDYYDR
jgi:cytosine/uracil/thiamine/allantoin permease